LNVDTTQYVAQADFSMNTQYYIEPEFEPNEMSVGYSARPADEPELAHPSLLSMQEIDSLREELRHERYRRLLAEGEIARMKFEEVRPSDQYFLGFPIRNYDSSDDDCQRTTWEVKIEGMWHEVITCGLRFDRKEAIESLCQILKAKI
jgi:hypothetical protein